MRSTSGALWSVAGAAALVLAGCAAGGGEQEAPEVVQQFFAAVQDGNAGSACALLTSQTRQELVVSDGEDCPQALPVDRLKVGAIHGVEVWSGWARVNTAAGAVFLTEFDAGWRISAVGCRSEDRSPEICVVG